ncbi:hypothetical protein ACFP3Q_03775 [Nocardioides sp. GCM10027113]|uniref:hypothetical protein n=1 Tax=unclassified Nocardioides TaxID=2615069 RepID=UPI003611DFEE
MTAPDPLPAVDPFDLPEWLGEGEVTWSAETGVRRGHRVPGELAGERGDRLPCDLLAVDHAHPAPVADDTTRTETHLAWRHGQILLVESEGRLTLAVPGSGFTADLVLDAVGRLAKAVGAPPDHYVARLRIAADGPTWEGSPL